MTNKPSPDVWNRCIGKGWKNFEFVQLTQENAHLFKEHMRNNFYRHETTNRLAGYSEEYAKDFDNFYIQFAIDDGLSFVALDKDTKEVAGARLTIIQSTNTDFSSYKYTSPQMKKLLRVVAVMDEIADIFNRLKITQLIMFVAASTDTKYRQQGLMTEMYVRTLDLVKSLGHQYIKCFYTSPWSLKCCKQLGFQEIGRKCFTDFEDEEGKKLFPDASDNEFAVMMYMDVKNDWTYSNHAVM